MNYKDTTRSYGLISVLFHWITAVLVAGLFGIGWYMVELTYYDRLYNVLPHWHKSVGMLFVLILFLRVFWRLLAGKPEALASHRRHELIAAPLVQWTMQLLLVVIVVSGYLIPTAAGRPIDVFDWFSVPALISDLRNQEVHSGLVHRYASYVLVAVVLLHVTAALKHHFMDKDSTLERMLGINNKGDE